MTSLTGNKERSSATARSRKYAIIDDSPTKSASYSAETWYRKSCEESRSGTRPAPEGAGSIPGSSGTPSPGSGISSPGSFAGSPGTTSPGVCTGSPGSLGGSPGFGTGSPGSGSGSSPGSDRGVWCENCNARLIELKRQALKLLIPGPFSSKDPSFPALLNDKLQVPNSARKAWNERDGRCDVCATHLSQLKQEAVYMVLSLEQAACPEGSEHSPSSPQPLASLPSLVGSRNILQGVPRDRAQPSAAYPSPSCGGSGAAPATFSKHGPKPSSLGVGSGVERRVGKTAAQILPQQHTVPSNVLSSVALQAHQYLESTWSMSRANGVTLYPCQMSQLVAEGGSDGLAEATLNRYNADHPVPHSSPAPNAPPVIAAPSSGTSAAASFFARAAQKLNLSSKKKKPRSTPSLACDPPPFPTNFSGILQTSPPPAPPCLLRAVNKVKDTPGLGKVKVMLRVCPILSSDTSESRSFLKVDQRKKQVTIMDPAANLGHGAQQKRAGGSQTSPKIFAFDATFSHEASQAEVCAGTVAEVIQSVVNGADGCVFCFGHAKLGKSYTMIGKDDSTQSLGIIPCTISWLFKLINERKEKTGARFSVRVSAVEVSGRDEVLTDLLSEVATGSLQDGQSPGVYLCEDPICGMQLQNQSELRAPTPEKAAYFLDAAIAARSSSRPSCGEEERRNSHMLFTLHVYQYRMDKASKGGMSGGRSRLHLIDLGSCVKVLSKTRDVTGGLCLSLSALGNVILALVNGSKHIPYKDSKLTMLLRESLGNMNCRTTMIAHISASPNNFSETLSTIQIASRVLRMKKKKAKQYTSSSSGGESSCEEGRIRRPTQLRTLHFQNVVDSELPLLHLSSDHDDYSSSEQSCDTVIYVGPDGTALSDKELTDNEGPPEVVPIVPSLQRNRNEKVGAPLRPPLQEPPPTQQQLQQELPSEDSRTGKPEQDCLKCNTFAELQERLECIDGSEEVSRFPFEEVPATKSAKGDLSSTPSQTIGYGQEKHQGKKHLHGQKQDNIQEVAVEPEITQCKIQNLAPSSPGSGELSSNRCVPGGSNSMLPADPLQKTQMSTVNETKESLSTVNHSESKVRSMGSPRLGIASLTKTSEYKPPSSPSQRCKVYTQKGVLPSMSSMSSLSSTGKSSTESLLQPEARISPVGMGPQVIKKSPSSSSMGSSDMQTEDPVQLALENKIEVQTSTTLTVQQPLELNGEDELVFTLVKELSISGLVENGRPTSIISFNSDCSVQALASGSRPVSIISSISEDLDGFPITSSSTTTATSAVSITTFLPLSKVHNTLSPSQHSSINSWLRDLNSSHNREQPCSDSTVQLCCNQRESQVEPLKHNLPEVQTDIEGKTSETEGHTAKISEKSVVSKEIPHFGKATVTISSVQNLGNTKDLVPIKAIITVNPCDALKTAVKHDSAEMSPCMKTTQIQDLKTPPVSISSKIKFEDPWMKREKEELKLKENVCVVKPEIKSSSSGTNKRQIESFIPERKGFLADSLKRVVDGCEIVLNTPDSLSPVCKEDILRTASLPRGWHRLNRQDEPEEPSPHYLYGEYNSLGVTTSTPCSPRATLERKGLSAKQSIFARAKGIPPLPPVRRSSLDQKNRVNLQFGTGNTSTLNQSLTFIRSPADDVGNNGKLKSTSIESSKLFSAKLEQLANRTSSLGRSHAAGTYDYFSLERADSLMSVGSRSSTGRDCTMPRVGRSLRRGSVSSPTNASLCNNTPQSPKASPSKISAVSKLLMVNPKARSLSASSTKTLSFSTKSLPQSVNRSSSLPPNGKNQNQGSWSTQSLSRSRGSGLASKLPLKAVNGRISELLQGGSARGGHGRRNSGVDDGGMLQGEERQATQTLPSPYSKITPPRRPHRCSSGHASDNSSVLSGELPPAMGKTALFYHSGGSSGYESMLRDSEATGSTSSAQDSTSDNSSSISGHRSVKSQKKRNNTGSQRRRLIPALSVDTASPVRKPAISPAVRWVDGPLRPSQRGLSDTFEIKVYEIDDVERLQRRRGVANKETVFFSTKLKILEHRQQRISVVRAKYDWLKKELEQTKQHLMLTPEKWTNEFDLQQTFEVDSLEYLEALEFVTGRLENRVNFYKAHLMMITCFDVTSRRR